jgi:hypothetical protein
MPATRQHSAPMRICRFLTAAAVIAPLLVACGPVPSRRAAPLEPEDFTLPGIPPEADSAEIRLSFGEPDSVVEWPNPYDAFSPILSWYYPAFVVRYEGSAVPTSYLLTGGDEATLRGVRVGDPASRVQELYGRPTFLHDPVWSYVDPTDEEGGRVVEFLMENDVVSRIHLGRGTQ